MATKEEQIIGTKESWLVAKEAVGLSEFPSKEAKTKIWVRAVALVTKQSGAREYVLVKHTITDDGTDKPSVVRDCGSMSRIKSFDEIRPYEYVSNAPKLTTVEEIIEYVSRHTGKSAEDYADTDKETLKQLARKYMIQQYLETSKFNK